MASTVGQRMARPMRSSRTDALQQNESRCKLPACRQRHLRRTKMRRGRVTPQDAKAGFQLVSDFSWRQNLEETTPVQYQRPAGLHRRAFNLSSVVPIAVPIRPIAVVSLVVPTVTVVMPPRRPTVVAVWRTHFYRRPAWTDIETDLRKGWYGGEHGRRRGDAKCKFSHVLLLSSSSVKTPAHAPRSDVPANPEGEIQSSTTSNRKRERDAGQGSSSVTRKGTTRLTRVPQVDIQLRTNRSRKMARLREFDYEQVLDGALQLFGAAATRQPHSTGCLAKWA
ncbi:MAG: hypothetical protein V7604_4534 [Hyphomicrobiales bacterium]